MTARIQPWPPAGRTRSISANQQEPLAAGGPGSNHKEPSWAISS